VSHAPARGQLARRSRATRSRLIPQVERHAPAREPNAPGEQLRSRSIRRVDLNAPARSTQGTKHRIEVVGVYVPETIRTDGRPNRPLQQTNAATIVVHS
jgi:hypothetical protein